MKKSKSFWETLAGVAEVVKEAGSGVVQFVMGWVVRIIVTLFAIGFNIYMAYFLIRVAAKYVIKVFTVKFRR